MNIYTCMWWKGEMFNFIKDKKCNITVLNPYMFHPNILSVEDLVK